MSLILAVVVVSGGFIAAITIHPTSVGATTLYVGGSGPGNYTKIQGAIDAASAGDTVYIHSGTYQERININKSLSVVGEDKDDTILDDAHYGAPAITVNVSWVNISRITVTNAEVNFAVWIYHARNVAITDCVITDNNTTAILIDYSSDVKIADNIVRNDLPFSYQPAITVFYSKNVTIRNNVISSVNMPSVLLSFSTNVTLSSNAMTDNGIALYGYPAVYWNTHAIDTSNTVNGKPIHYWKNTAGVSVPIGAGQVILANTTGVVVERQSMTGEVAIQIGHSSENRIINNTISSDTASGILISNSTGDTIADNTLTNGYINILVESSKGLHLNNNTMKGGGIFMEGSLLQYWNTHTIDSSNTINGNPVYYRKNVNGGTLPPGGGQVILANCTDVTVGNMEAVNLARGISLAFSSRNTVTDNTISGNVWGLYLVHSDNNTILNNIIKGNHYFGVFLEHSWRNKFYHNDFIDNWNDAYEDQLGSSPFNFWNDTYPNGGNYWSKYKGEDRCKGPHQDDCSGPDGIGDTSYRYDNYPLMKPFNSEEEPTPDLLLFVALVVAAVVVVIAVLLMIRRKRRKRRKATESAAPHTEVQPPESEYVSIDSPPHKIRPGKTM